MLPSTSYVQLSMGDDYELSKVESKMKPIRKENVQCDNLLCPEDKRQLLGVPFELPKNCLMCNEPRYCYNPNKE